MQDLPRPRPSEPDSLPSLHQLADFRYQLGKFLRFSEKTARANGLTPQQHQLLLG